MLINDSKMNRYRVPAAQEPTNLRPFKDFLMPKVKTLKTSFSIQKIRKTNHYREITMLINIFHGKQHHTFTKIYKSYNRITTRVLINNSRFRMVWCSQCNGGQKSERHERPIKIASDMQKDFAARKAHFHSNYIHNAF